MVEIEHTQSLFRAVKKFDSINFLLIVIRANLVKKFIIKQPLQVKYNVLSSY
jgi:hypothetical protein